MRIVKVYTKTGDKGTTGLADGNRVPKDDLRIECYGTIDELNSILGICRQNLEEMPKKEKTILDSWIYSIQNDLFNLGADLATPLSSRWKNMIVLNETDTIQLEKMIDFCQNILEPLQEFVLPGGTKLNSYFHLARTVCRRAERLTVALSMEKEINPNILPYINRLSDLFFVLSRWVQKLAKSNEVTWNKNSGVRTIEF
ncbi:cob(I)yrinic acid a,c-diamide adenosyltransferase [Pigmentibacter sp. JX0631]|uniref:cob(I)yrinic acid a,c-diamide adenosyltransferase n=1 Tax=Pigmentibacter sp. JX0631 TaxID=2976982 RepID=UPI0024694289|nr:cob(I)yrinic acid a,c-diamide adenosyltransferase [Pigmentibacter sp. JX0631]WGL61413.1 cob(I)yrinic acid a,c-diamide adenosyltransferase [Pigmentibacter sp. JX0631]